MTTPLPPLDGIGVGDYPNATVDEVVAQDPTIVLVMGVDNNERHDHARALRPRLRHGALILRRRFLSRGLPDFDGQVDLRQTPDAEAARIFPVILGGLSPAEFLTVYDGTVGTSETWDNNRPATWAWVAAFELALCRLVQHAGIPYIAVKAAPGNLDATDAVRLLGPLFAEAAAWCADAYCQPRATTFDPPAVTWYARRPFAIWQDMHAAGLTVPPFLATEIGPWDSPRRYQMNDDQRVAQLQEYPRVFAEWRAVGMPILGCIYFADGAEGMTPTLDPGATGNMGFLWNLEASGQRQIGEWNSQSHILTPPRLTIPQKGRRPMPTIGAGFQKCVPLAGQPVEDQVYHQPGTPQETALVIFQRGSAMWRKATNQTVLTIDDGTVYDDLGNHGDGHLVEIHGPFPKAPAAPPTA